jgi:hypothetical protein
MAQTETSGFPGFGDEDFDIYEAMSEMGDDWERFLKGGAVQARFQRNANVAADQATRRARDAQDFFLGKKKMKLQKQLARQRQLDQDRTDAERRARREQRSGEYARTQGFREESAQYRRQRDAEQQAYREAQDAARQDRRDAASRTPASFSTGTSGVVPSGGGWSPNKESVAKFIIFATALGAIGAVANDLSRHTQATTLSNGVKVPAHLRALGGAFIAGTIALILNEVYPAAGAVMGAGIVGIIVIPNWTPLLGKIGGVFDAKTVGPKAPATGGSSNLPKSLPPQGGVWLPGGNPGPQRGASPGTGPIEVPYGSPSG